MFSIIRILLDPIRLSTYILSFYLMFGTSVILSTSWSVWSWLAGQWLLSPGSVSPHTWGCHCYLSRCQSPLSVVASSGVRRSHHCPDPVFLESTSWAGNYFFFSWYYSICTGALVPSNDLSLRLTLPRLTSALSPLGQRSPGRRIFHAKPYIISTPLSICELPFFFIISPASNIRTASPNHLIFIILFHFE